MSYHNNRTSMRGQVVRMLAAVSLALVALCASPAALAVDAGDIVVVSSKGEVHFTLGGVERAVRAGGVLEPPASLRTGRDGAVELRQGATTVSVGPETVLEFPALEKRGAPIDRIVQPRGNAFYNIGKREGRKLRVETPYLVGVIKGTQFNVSVLDASATISLFEGLLEVRAADDSGVFDLKAGEIASLKQGDKSIGVMKMDSGKTPATSPRRTPGSGSNTGTPVPSEPRATPANDGHDLISVDSGGGASSVLPRVVDAPGGTAANVEVTAVTGTTGVDAGAVSFDTVDDVNIDAGSVDASTSAGIDAGDAPNADGASVDLTPTTTVDAGPIAADVGSTTAVDLGAGTVDAGITTTVDTGALTTDASAGAAVDLGAGTVGAAVDVGAATPIVVVDAGVSAAVDVPSGSVDLGLTVAGADLDLGVDLGLDDGNNGHGNDADHSDSSNPGNGRRNSTPDTDVGGLLDGVLRRPGKKR